MSPGSRTFSAWRRGRIPGFSLVELIATMVVLSTLGSIALSLLMTAMDSFADSATAAQLHAEASIAMDRIGRELSSIPLDGSASGIAPDVDSVSASSITWGNSSSMTLSAGRVMLAIDGGTSAVLLDDVTAFSVSTFNQSNTALAASLSGANCDPIRRIAVSVTLSRAGTSHTLSSKFYIRSTMQGAGTL